MKSFKPSKFLILIVDDIRQNLQVVGNILEGAGYKTTFATNGKQGIERAKTAYPDLILLDLMMPEMDGFEVCHILKSDENLARIPIIFLTASNEKEHLIHACKEGAADYVTKPFNRFELLARVETHLKLSDRTQQLKKALEIVEKLSIDFLTGINNRYAFNGFVQEKLNALTGDEKCYLFLIDIDRFRDINETYNIIVGDKLLKQCVEVIKTCLQDSDYFARIGGEEFAILSSPNSPEEALQFANTIKETIDNHIFTVQSYRIKITIKMTWTTFSAEDSCGEQILRRVWLDFDDD
ncbi:response regulator [Crocosphaera sp.]|uniref:response regulator n=1 Tax=Crocosphaera sp. TaxID=2729996 RepID=UPI003F23BA58